ncbi:hypothetical protein GQ55_7G111300 [Panicum hallii var. hallii]|uniref:Uncharacterized protein n=1 Tax=Panicum hallii var. hallii TaxID=1504633 RepID=A0A2T7CTX3_9POAL|nr:hypothetical protein GQ55_7G111300 [Panicum hallii var. hallii]
MSPQDPLTKGHVSTTDDDAVHGQPPAPVAPAVIDDRGKERKRRKHEDAAGAGVAATAARSSEIDVAANDEGRGTCGARRHQHRRPRAPESGSGKYGPGTTIVIGGRHRHHQAVAGSSSGGSIAYADHDAAAPSSFSRLIREPAAAPHHHLPKPPKAHGAPSSSASASAAQREPADPELCYRLGLEAVVMMGKAALRDEVNAFAGVKDYQRQQQQPAAEAVETKRFSFWLTDDERKADLAAVYKKLKKARRAAAAGNATGNGAGTDCSCVK